MSACIIGWHHLKFGRHDGVYIEDLITEAAAGALAHAALEPSDVDQIFLGTFNSGFVQQDFPSSLTLAVDDDLRFTPSTRVENACATGSAAIFQGANAIEARRARRCLTWITKCRNGALNLRVKHESVMSKSKS